MARGKWSHEETSALVRAYKDALEGEPRNASRGMFERFCAFYYGGDRARSEASVRLRKDQLVNMVEVAFAYYEARRDGKDGVLGDRGDSTDNSSRKTEASDRNEDAADQVIRAWWSLTEAGQKIWHSRLNTKSYPFVDIEEDHFRTIAAITKQRSASSHQRCKFPGKAASADHEALTRRATELLEDRKLSLEEHIQANSSAVCDDLKPTDDDAASNHSGSSTESDDEIVECWDEIVPRSPLRDPRSSDESAQQCNNANDKQKGDNRANSHSSWQSWTKGDAAMGCDQMAPPRSRKRKRQVDPEIMGLVDILERQARLLGDMFRQAKEARKQEQQERQHILQLIQQEKIARAGMLERVMRSEDATRKARDEWKQERDELEREWVTVRDRKRQR